MATHEEIHNKVKEFVGDPCYVVYSAYEVENEDYENGIIDNLNNTVENGKCIFIRTENCGNFPYISEVIDNPTWLDVCKVANDSIVYIDENGHIDHVYLEKIDYAGALWFGEIKIYEMFFGS